MCHVCRTTGATSLNLVEHDMVQKTQETLIFDFEHVILYHIKKRDGLDLI